MPNSILIVDDSRTNLLLVETVLKSRTRCPPPAAGRRPSSKFERVRPPDLILLDIMMPGMSGYEACAELKEDPSTRNIPIIFLTGQSELEEEVKGFQLGAVDYITKPICAATLLARVGTHLENARLYRRRIESQLLRRALEPQWGLSKVGVQAGHRFLPSRLMSGDFCDLIDLGGSCFAVTMADVAGKGPEAAIQTIRAKYLIRASAQAGLSPGAILGALNEELNKDSEARTLTVFLAKFDMSCRTMVLQRGSRAALALAASGRRKAGVGFHGHVAGSHRPSGGRGRSGNPAAGFGFDSVHRRGQRSSLTPGGILRGEPLLERARSAAGPPPRWSRAPLPAPEGDGYPLGGRIMKPETIAIHSGYTSDPTTKSVAVPIYQTVAYEFDNAQHGADLFNLAVPGNIYTRIMNPTNDVLEKRVAELEGGLAGLALSSGSAAVNYSILTVAEAGNNIVSVPLLYGGTYTLFAHMLPRLGIEVRFAADDQPSSLEALIDDKTSAVYCESIGNPAGNIVDLEAIATMAHKHGVPVIVDNTVATPALIRPIDYGVDIVVHSLTKYMGGHGNSLGGIIVDSGKFPWAQHAARFPVLNQPEPAYHGVVYTQAFGPAAYIGRARTVPLRNTGSALSPLNAFLLLQGIETLPLRMERHCQNAMAVANYLSKHPKVSWVNYAGLPNSPYYALAQKYTQGRPSALLTFGVKGGFEAGVRFYDALKLFKRLVNIGDVKSLAAHPASTTHRQMSAEEQAQAQVTPDMVRLCIGIEHIDDILADLEQALNEGRSR